MYLAPGTWATLVKWAPFDPGITRFYAAALLALGTGSWLGYRTTGWERVRILVQMEIVFSVLGALAALCGAFVVGAPAFNWLAIAVFAIFAVAWVVYYRQTEV